MQFTGEKEFNEIIDTLGSADTNNTFEFIQANQKIIDILNKVYDKGLKDGMEINKEINKNLEG